MTATTWGPEIGMLTVSIEDFITRFFTNSARFGDKTDSLGRRGGGGNRRGNGNRNRGGGGGNRNRNRNRG